MADWSVLLSDLLVKISKKVTYFEDFHNFAKVCKTWRSAAATITAPLSSKFPSMILPDDDEDDANFRKFYHLSGGGIISKLRLPEANKKRCLSTQGWLFTVAEVGFETKIFHPLTGREIDLPRLDSLYLFPVEPYIPYVRKVIFSADPLLTPEFLVIIIYGKTGELGFCKPGDVKWSNPINLWGCTISDIVYHKRKIYAVDAECQILVCDIHGLKKLIAVSEGPNLLLSIGLNYLYILASYDDDKFLVFLRELDEFSEGEEEEEEEEGGEGEGEGQGQGQGQGGGQEEEEGGQEEEEEEEDYRTKRFQVFEFDLNDNKWLKIEKLGNKTVFLGYNSTFSMELIAEDYIKPNCIYFTDDLYDTYFRTIKGGGKDVGIYNLSDGTVKYLLNEKFRSHVTPPTWIEPSF